MCVTGEGYCLKSVYLVQLELYIHLASDTQLPSSCNWFIRYSRIFTSIYRFCSIISHPLRTPWVEINSSTFEQMLPSRKILVVKPPSRVFKQRYSTRICLTFYLFLFYSALDRRGTEQAEKHLLQRSEKYTRVERVHQKRTSGNMLVEQPSSRIGARFFAQSKQNCFVSNTRRIYCKYLTPIRRPYLVMNFITKITFLSSQFPRQSAFVLE